MSPLYVVITASESSETSLSYIRCITAPQVWSSAQKWYEAQAWNASAQYDV